MTIETDQASLIRVIAAIAQIESGGQEKSIRDNSVRKADLKVLYARQDQLENRIARALSGGGIRIRGGTPV